MVADYILRYGDEVSELTAEELGEATYTSKSTILRFCQKLGFSGFKEFQYQLVIEQFEKERLLKYMDDDPFTKNTTLDEIENILPAIYKEAIETTKAYNNKSVIEKMIEKINEGRRVDLYATGITYNIALTTSFKLQSIGIACTVQSSINEHALMRDQSDRVAIVLSFTGNNPGVVHMAQYLKSLGHEVFSITGGSDSKINEICDGNIEIYAETSIMSLEAIAPTIAMTYILDVIFSGLIVSEFDKNIQAAMDVDKHHNEFNE